MKTETYGTTSATSTDPHSDSHKPRKGGEMTINDVLMLEAT